MVDLIILALPDHVPDRLVHPQDLKGRDHPAPCPRQQLLADHALQNRRQLLPGLALLDRTLAGLCDQVIEVSFGMKYYYK